MRRFISMVEIEKLNISNFLPYRDENKYDSVDYYSIPSGNDGSENPYWGLEWVEGMGYDLFGWGIEEGNPLVKDIERFQSHFKEIFGEEIGCNYF